MHTDIHYQYQLSFTKTSIRTKWLHFTNNYVCHTILWGRIQIS